MLLSAARMEFEEQEDWFDILFRLQHRLCPHRVQLVPAATGDAILQCSHETRSKVLRQARSGVEIVHGYRCDSFIHHKESIKTLPSHGIVWVQTNDHFAHPSFRDAMETDAPLPCNGGNRPEPLQQLLKRGTLGTRVWGYRDNMKTRRTSSSNRQ